MSAELSTMAERYDASRWRFLTNAVHNHICLLFARRNSLRVSLFPHYPFQLMQVPCQTGWKSHLINFSKKNAEWVKEWWWMEVYIYESGWKLHLIRIFKKFYWNVWNCHFLSLPLYQSSARCWLINNNNNRLWIHWNPFTRRTLLFQKRAMHFVPHFKR